VPLEYLHAQQGQVAERIREAYLALAVGHRFLMPLRQVKVAAVVARDQQNMLIRQRLAAVAVGDADGDGLVVHFGKDLIGCAGGDELEQQGCAEGEGQESIHEKRLTESIGGALNLQSFLMFPGA
jgi:hypothetical protein